MTDSWKKAYSRLIRTIMDMGYPEEFGKMIASSLGSENTMNRMINYLIKAKPETPEEIADEMLAIDSDRNRWKEKKQSEEAAQRYYQLRRNGFETMDEDLTRSFTHGTIKLYTDCHWQLLSLKAAAFYCIDKIQREDSAGNIDLPEIDINIHYITADPDISASHSVLSEFFLFTAAFEIQGRSIETPTPLAELSRKLLKSSVQLREAAVQLILPFFRQQSRGNRHLRPGIYAVVKSRKGIERHKYLCSQ
ncbi:MAG: hypothetical protein PUG95_01565, partial [Firmicutes bacterium]|nr:hypothetical protein [Bacillota bacterium]